MALAVLVNVLLACEPRAVIAVMQTTMMRANMTAYSTAVGPSSRFRKSTTKFFKLFISIVLWKKRVEWFVGSNLGSGLFSALSWLRSAARGCVQRDVAEHLVCLTA